MISIIIPAYNSEHTIIKTLISLQQQTIKALEVIIINDGSTDNTKNIVSEFIFNNNLNWQLIHQTNQGAGIARNTGIKIISKDYVLFLDADDYLSNNALELMYATLVKGNADLVFSSYVHLYLNGTTKIVSCNYESYKNTKLIELFYRRLIFLGIGNTLFKYSIIKEHNIFFKNYKLGEDNEFFRRLVLYVNKAASIKENLFFYVQNSASSTNSSYRAYKIDSIISVIDTKKFIIDNFFDSKFNSWNNIFLILEVAGNALEYVKSTKKMDKNFLYHNILNFLPYTTDFKLFFSKKRTLVLLALYIFYKFPLIILILAKYLFKSKKDRLKLQIKENQND